MPLASQKELKHLLTRDGINRRAFMGRAAALGVGTVLATSLWSTRAKAAKRGGTMRVGIGQGSTTDTFDPGLYEDTYMQTIGNALRNNLTEVDADGKLVPELASSWDTKDAKTWVFSIRKGVEFHNGKTLDSTDVVSSINHHINEDSKSAAKGILKQISSIKKDGKNTVIIELDSANADFPFILSDYHIGMMPDVDGKADWESRQGTGGYTVADFNAGVQTRLVRNPNYWKPDRAHFDEIESTVIPDVTARSNALRIDEIDIMNRCDLKTVDLLAKTPGIEIEEITGTQHYTFPMLMDVAPFDNNHVRMALKLGLDREQLLKLVLRGHGAVGNDHPISPANRYHNADLPQRKYDPEKAKWHLKQAGLSTVKVDLSAADAAFAGAVDAAMLYRENSKAAGIDITVVREPNDGYWSNVWMKKPWGACYWGGRPTEDWMFSTAYQSGVPWNDTHFEHARFNELLIQGRAELVDSKRREIYGEMQAIVRDEGGTVVPIFANYVFAHSKKLDHGKVATSMGFDGLKLFERWWFA